MNGSGQQPAPLVSFLIAAYNAAPFIREAVDSCLEQSHPNVEVVVIDDGSLDQTLEVLRGHYSNNPRVKVRSFGRNKGKVAAYNECFRHSCGELIAIMGADDVSIPERAAKSIAAMRQHGAEMVCGDCIAYDEAREISRSLARDWFGLLQDGEVSFDSQLRRPKVFGGTLMMRRSLAESLFPVDERLGHEDWWLPLAAAHRQRVWFMAEPVLRYRFHGLNSSRNSPEIDFERWLSLSVREIPYYEAVKRTFELTRAQEAICRSRLAMLELLSEPRLTARLARALRAAGVLFSSGLPCLDRAKFLMAAASPRLSFRAARRMIRKRREG